MRSTLREQGVSWVEYALIVVLVAEILIVLLALLGLAMDNAFAQIISDPLL